MDIKHLLDELEEIIYVSDIQTHELLYTNNAGKKLLSEEDLLEKKRYKILGKQNETLDFNVNPLLNHVDFYNWQYTDQNNRHYIIKDKLILWDEIEACLEVAIDITNKVNAEIVIQEEQEMEQLLMECISYLVINTNISDGIGEVLASIGRYYKADRVAIFEQFPEEAVIRITNEWCTEGVAAQKDIVDDITLDEAKIWLDMLEKENKIVITDVVKEKLINPEKYKSFKFKGVNNIILISLKENHRICGFISLQNPKRAIENTTLLDSLSNYLLKELKKRKTENQLNFMSYHDALTGLFNRNKYLEYIKEFSCQKLDSLGVIFVDLNGLKVINDTYGHSNGDHAIMGTSSIIKKHFRSDDVYRIGGDEFVVLSENIPLNLFEDKVTDLKSEFGETRFYNVSIGSSWSNNDIDINELIKKADECMYINKREYYKDKKENLDNRSPASNKLINADSDVIDLRLMMQYEELALNTYDQIHCINVMDNQTRIIYQSKQDVLKTYQGQYFQESVKYILKNYVHPGDRKLVREQMSEKCLLNLKSYGGRIDMEYRYLGKNERYHWVSQSIFTSKYQPQELLVAVKNIDYIMKQNRKVKDNLTGLYNHEAFCQKVTKLLIQKSKLSYVLIVMDINKFKVINEIYGIRGGNDALIETSQILIKQVKNIGICSRMCADIFHMLIECPTDEGVNNFIEQITKELQQSNFGSMLKPIFGVCRISDPSIPIFTLCEMAGYVHNFVKEQGTMNYMYYDDNIKRHVIEEKQKEREMEEALLSSQFHVYLQPKYNLKLNKVVGAEALVRWMHPEKGLIPPKEFIKLFERNGFILKLDRFVWEKSCEILRSWIDEGKEAIPISVNISKLNLQNSKFRQNILELLECYKIPKHLLELELTENLFSEDVAFFAKVVEDLRKEGLVLNMDDFGSGHSSLNMLKNIPIDILKIDCSHFDSTGLLKRDKIILSHVIAMAKDLDIRLVAEGVETQEQVDFLEQMNCHVIQGYYYSKPVPVEEIDKIVYKK